MPDKTRTQVLLERVYPADLEQSVSQLRTHGWSWRSIADHVSEECGLAITHESLRSWYDTEDARAG